MLVFLGVSVPSVKNHNEVKHMERTNVEGEMIGEASGTMLYSLRLQTKDSVEVAICRFGDEKCTSLEKGEIASLNCKIDDRKGTKKYIDCLVNWSKLTNNK